MPQALPTSVLATPSPHAGARELYFQLLQAQGPVPAAREFLTARLEEAAAQAAELPGSPRDLTDWIRRNSEQVGRQYQDYLAQRQAGAPRRYFGCKSHALYFLKAVAPTKLVDGAWLAGLLPRWDDPRFRALIRIYLEELGEGVPSRNHVLLYRRLLETHGCQDWERQPEARFTQGAIQLALARLTPEFLPEVIGYNLGYEQLPLHLLITAYELAELGIDPYYFTLHVTVDNAASGHALKAVQGLTDALPRAGDADAFYRRVIRGFQLNGLGEGSLDAIAGFDLERELVAALAAKAVAGATLHSDYCRFDGRTVNEWLSEPGRIPEFLQSLQAAGWIRRHRHPRESRFWRLLQGEGAVMFGVFTPYEQQLIYDWIAGDAAPSPRRWRHRPGERALSRRSAAPPRSVFRSRPEQAAADECESELRLLELRLAGMSRADAMDALIRLMGPDCHHSAAGLMATRVFTRLFD